MKNFILLFLILLSLGVWGCVTVDHTTLIDTDKDGYANGQFRDVRNGRLADVTLFGGGGAGSAGSSLAAYLPLAATSSAASAGAGMFGLGIRPAPSQGDPVPFAKSIAMINYSKRLQSIKYDEMGGIIEYEFGPGPMSMRSESPAPKGAKMPSAFGHQPVE